MNDLWLTDGRLVTPQGITRGAVRVVGGRIRTIRRAAPRGAHTRSVRGAYVSPGFIDLHVWGPIETIAREAVKGGTTAFLSTLGPEPSRQLVSELSERASTKDLKGAAHLGVHLEGPFVNPRRGGALPKRWMRSATERKLNRLWRASRGCIRLMTLAPERQRALGAIRWCARHHIVASLGHSESSANTAQQAVAAGARAVTHVFNGMPPLHHRHPSLLDVALMDDRLKTMVILDGVHVSPSAFRLLVRAKGAERIALVTDSIAHQGWDVVKRGGAYYRRDGTLAGSALRMIDAVRNAVELGGVSLADAVTMATEVPAHLLGDRTRGVLDIGKRADLVVFNEQFSVLMTIVNGNIVYQRGV